MARRRVPKRREVKRKVLGEEKVRLIARRKEENERTAIPARGKLAASYT